jgi:hypothetical protein
MANPNNTPDNNAIAHNNIASLPTGIDLCGRNPKPMSNATPAPQKIQKNAPMVKAFEVNPRKCGGAIFTPNKRIIRKSNGAEPSL